MFTILINNERMTGTFGTAKEARDKALGLLDALSIVSHQTKTAVRVSIVDSANRSVWDVWVGSVYGQGK